MILSFRKDKSWQTLLTQMSEIWYALEEQSDLGLHRSPFHMDVLNTFLLGKTTLFKFLE